MNGIVVNIICFLTGLIFSGLVMSLIVFKMIAGVKKDFAAIAYETIKNEQEDLRKQNREALEEKIAPFAKEIKDFRDKVDKFNLTGAENTAKIIEQITILNQNSKSIEAEAKNLAEALTKNQNVKGAFGEEILDTILQNCGMVEGIHYNKQYSTVSENSKDETTHKIRPDIVINLPDDRHLIIDSKVTLTSYLEYINDKSKLKDFKAEVKRRLIELADKNYHKANDINQPDFVIMYLPIDSSVSLIYEDSELIDLAYKSNVIISGTASLLVAIRLVNQLFALQKQNENVHQIVNTGTNLYETFVRFCNDLCTLQKDFNGLSQQFTTTVNRFKRTNKSKPDIFTSIEELKNYGINSSKEIPAVFLSDNITEVQEEVYTND